MLRSSASISFRFEEIDLLCFLTVYFFVSSSWTDMSVSAELSFVSGEWLVDVAVLLVLPLIGTYMTF